MVTSCVVQGGQLVSSSVRQVTLSSVLPSVVATVVLSGVVGIGDSVVSENSAYKTIKMIVRASLKACLYHMICLNKMA